MLLASAFYVAAYGVSVHVRTLPAGDDYPVRISYRLHGHDTVASFPLDAPLHSGKDVRLAIFPGEAHPIVMLLPVVESRDSPTYPHFYHLANSTLRELPILFAGFAGHSKHCFSMPANPVKLYGWNSSNPLAGRSHVSYYAAHDDEGSPVVVEVDDLYEPGGGTPATWTPPPPTRVAGLRVCKPD